MVVYATAQTQAPVIQYKYFSSAEKAGRYLQKEMMVYADNKGVKVKLSKKPSSFWGPEIYGDNLMNIAINYDGGYSKTPQGDYGNNFYNFYDWDLHRNKYKTVVKKVKVGRRRYKKVKSYYYYGVLYQKKDAETQKEISDSKKSDTIYNEWFKQMNLSQYSTTLEKAKAAHNFIIDQVTYDGAIPEVSHTIVDATLNHKIVCDGYATLFYRIMRQAGVPCRVIVSDDHAFNIIKMENGKWYYVDVCWDDAYTEGLNRYSYKYFLLGYQNFEDPKESSHIPLHEYRSKSFRKVYPISKTDYDVNMQR